ncbi:hypothetical protein BKA62DRAFT_669944 [Auriculariales sp. MPI-PUGE-AT-0066]|nr:hypothetical protein BKA62DRAFT_669944 [Auriculariales sp. MPI-PUGE-AT-0066]
MASYNHYQARATAATPPQDMEQAQIQITALQTELYNIQNHNMMLTQQLQQLQQLQSRPPVPSHQERQRRADARLIALCSANRVGISTCNWHATRNKTKEYPARQAPQGMLNCGCTKKDALFEESLARNYVGSYGPGGERIHPVIRGALLALLERRYGYADGDFEIDIQTGVWPPGQDVHFWEQQAAARH